MTVFIAPIRTRYKPDDPPCHMGDGAMLDSSTHNQQQAALKRFAELGFEKVREMVHDGYDGFDNFEERVFAIQWLKVNPAAIATANTKFDAFGYDRVLKMVDGSSDDECYEE